MFNYKKIYLPKIFTIFFLYSTNKTESPCANSRYSQCLNCFSYLLPAVLRISPFFVHNILELHYFLGFHLSLPSIWCLDKTVFWWPITWETTGNLMYLSYSFCLGSYQRARSNDVDIDLSVGVGLWIRVSFRGEAPGSTYPDPHWLRQKWPRWKASVRFTWGVYWFGVLPTYERRKKKD